MARPIDEKIVAMKMDNSDFNKKVKDTLMSFDLMNKSISDVGEIDLSKLESSLEKMENRIGISGVMIGTAISKLTSSFIDKGVGLWNSALDPLIEGGKKRALNIEQAKFQFQGLGMDVEKTMQSALDAVKGTAYGLDEAAVVAGQFGATGIQAGEQMTAYLRGISGVAAMTGSSYSDVGNIFTTVAGNGRLMGAELLRLSARGVNAAAILSKELGVTEGEVRKMVTDGKISFDMFAQAMNNAFGEHATRANETYVGSLSNVKAALGRIGAAVATPEFENKRNIFNALTPKIDELADALGPLIKVWNEFRKMKADNLINLINKISFKKFTELGGAANLAEAFGNTLKLGTVILDEFKKAFSGVGPSGDTFVKFLVKGTSGLKLLSEMLLIVAKGIGKTAIVFKIIVDVLQIVWKFAVRVGKALANLIPKSSGTSSFFESLSKLTESMNKSMDAGNLLTKTIDGLGRIAKPVGEYFTNLGNIFDEVFSILGRGDFKGVGPWEEDSKMVGILFKIRDAAITTFEYLNSLSIDDMINGVVDGFNWVVDKVVWFGNAIKDVWNGIVNNMPSGNTVVAGGFLGAMITGFGFITKLVWDFVNSFKNWNNIGDSISGVLDGFSDAMGEVEGVLKSFTMEIKSKALLNIALAVGVLAASLWVISRLDGGQISWSIGAIVVSLGALVGALALMSKFDITGTGNGAILQLVGFALALNIIASAMNKLGDLSVGEATKGVVAVVVLLGALSGAMILMSKFAGPEIGATSLQIVAISASLFLISFALTRLAKLNASNLWNAVGAIVAAMGAIAIFMNVINKTSFGPSQAIGMVIIGSSLIMMAGAISLMSRIDNGRLKKGLTVIGGVLLALSVFALATSKSNLHTTALGLVLVAAAMTALVVPITLLGKMKLSTIVKGLGTIAVALIAVGVASKLLTGSALAGAGLIVMALGLNLLVVPIMLLAQIPFKKLIGGLSGLALGIIMLGGAAALMGVVAAPLLAGAGALLVLGVAIALAGAGMALFGSGLVSLALLTGTAAATIVAYLGTLIAGLMSLVPKAVEFIWFIIVSMAEAFRDNAYILSETVMMGMIKVMDSIRQFLPEFATSATLLLIAFADEFEKNFPILTDKIGLMTAVFMESMANSVDEHGPRIIDAFKRLFKEILEFFIEVFVGIMTTLTAWSPRLQKEIEILGLVAKTALEVSFDTGDVADTKMKLFAARLEGNTGDVERAAEIMGVSAKDALDLSADFGSLGTKHPLDYQVAMMANKHKAEEAADEMARRAKETAEGHSFSGSGEKAASGFASGMGTERSKSLVSSAASALASLANKALNRTLLINSPSRLTMIGGNSFSEGFAVGITNKAKMVDDSAKGLAKTAVNSLDEFIDGFALPEDNNEIHFRAVLNYDQFNPNGFGNSVVAADTTMTRRLMDGVSRTSRQNGNNITENGDIIRALESVGRDDGQVVGLLEQVLTSIKSGQVIMMDGRKVGEIVEPHVKNIQDKNLIRKNRARGF